MQKFFEKIKGGLNYLKKLPAPKKTAIFLVSLLILAVSAAYFFGINQNKPANSKTFRVLSSDLENISAASTKAISFWVTPNVTTEEIERNLTVSPPLKGRLELNNAGALTYHFEQPLWPNTVYTFTFKKGLTTISGTKTTEDIKWYLKTSNNAAFVNLSDYLDSNLIITNTQPYDNQNMVLTNQEIIVLFKDKDSVPEVSNFAAHFKISPEVKGEFKVLKNNAIALIPEKDLEYGTTYNIVIAKGLKTKKDSLTEDYTFSFTTRSADIKESIGFDHLLYSQVTNKPFHVLLTNEKISNNIALSLYKVDNNEFINYLEKAYTGKEISDLNLKPIKTWEVTPSANWDNYIEINPLPSGSYILKGKSGKIEGNCLISVSKTGATVHRGNNETLVWAVDLESGKKSSLNLDFYSYDWEKEAMEKTGSGTTNQNGVWRGNYNFNFLVGTNGEDQFIVESRYFGWHEEYIIRGTSDKTLYSPGETLKYRFIIRKNDKDKRYGENSFNYELTIQNNGNSYVAYRQKAFSKDGVIAGEIPLDAKFPPGEYSASSKIDGKEVYSSLNFRVQSFVKSDFKIELDAGKETVISGDEVSFKGNLLYYSDQPIPNAKIEYKISESEVEEPSHTDPLWLYGHYGSEKFTEQTKTNQNGEFNIKYQTPKSTGKAKIVKVTAEYKDQGISVSASKNMLVHAANFKLSAHSNSYSINPSTDAKVTVKAQNFDNSPYAQRVSGEAKITLKTWEKEERNEKWTNKYDHYTYKEKIIDIATKKFDLLKETEINFGKLEKGYYNLLVTAKDKNGNLTQRETYLWVSETGYSVKNERIELIADKDKYEIGDTAKVTVNLPEGSGDVLMIIGRNDIYDYKILTAQADLKVDIPILEKYITNIGVDVATYKNGTFYNGSQLLKVPATSRKLDLEIKPDKQDYKPGDEVKLTIKSKDHKSAPTKSNLLISVVDQAVLDIMPYGSRNIYDTFYYDSWMQINFDHSLRGIYFAGGKGGGGGESRSDFKDTAYFNPNIATNQNGELTVKFKLPDNLTSWNIFVEGFTSDMKVGSNSLNIVTKKELSLRPILPKFLYIGDEFKVKTSISNHSGQNGKIELLSENKGVEQKEKQLSFNLEKGNTIIKSFAAKIKDKVSIVLSAKGNNLNDAVTVNIPTEKYGYTDTDIIGKEGKGTIKLDFSEANIEKSDAKITIYPSIASSVQKIYQDISVYPYGCAEQSASKARVYMAVLKNSKTLDLTEEKKKEIDKTIKELTYLIQGTKNRSGWGAWPLETSDSKITAYIYDTLKLLQANGYKDYIQETILKDTEEYLNEAPEGEESRYQVSYHESFFTYYYKDPGLNTDIYSPKNLKNTSDSSKIYYSLVQIKRGNKEEAWRVLSTVKTTEKETIAFVNSKGLSMWDNQTALTSLYAIALQELGKENRKFINWLVVSEDLKYQSSYQAATASTALLAYLNKQTDALNNLKYTVKANGKEIDKGQISSNLTQPKEIDVPLQNKVLLEVTAEGEGNLFYDVKVNKFLSGLGQKKSNGLEVTRKYRVNGNHYLSDRFRPGDIVNIDIAIKNPNDLSDSGFPVIINDYLPAGLVPISLQHARSGYSENDPSNTFNAVGIQNIEYWDDHVTIASNKKFVSYFARAITEGTFQTKPTYAMFAYRPEIWGRSEGKIIEIDENAKYGPISSNYPKPKKENQNEILNVKQSKKLPLVMGIFTSLVAFGAIMAYKKSTKCKHFFQSIVERFKINKSLKK